MDEMRWKMNLHQGSVHSAVREKRVHTLGRARSSLFFASKRYHIELKVAVVFIFHVN